MGIVLNEYEWAEKMIGAKSLGSKPSETLNRVSKYYLENQYSKREVRRMLDNFLLQCDPNASLVNWSDTLDRIVKNAAKYPPVQIEHIVITQPELDKISLLGGVQLRRLAFTLLCVARYWDSVSANNDHWVNSSDREIMQMANINTSIKRQSAMFGELRELGLIRFSKKIDNLNVQVTFMEEGEPALYIHDYTNLGFQYLKYCGGPYFECANCGIVTRAQDPARGRPQKYCASCAIEVRTRQNIDAVMRHREALKS